jgi:predicted ArsR family transcriptional regulator
MTRPTPNTEDSPDGPDISSDPTAELGRLKLAALRNPVVSAIVTRLGLGDATAAEVAAETGVPVETVRRHLRRMTRSDLVQRSGSSRRAGRDEAFYGFDPRRARLTPAELAALPRRQVEEAHVRLLRTTAAEATAAIEAGTFGSRDESAAFRYGFSVDKARLGRAVQIHEELLEDIFEIAASSKARMSPMEISPIEAGVALILQPLPQDRWPRPIARQNAFSRPGRRLSTRDPLALTVTVSEPVRDALLDLLNTGYATTGELAARTGVPIERCRAELRRLWELGIVEVHDRRQRRGTSEYVYANDPRKLSISPNDAASYPGSRLDKFRGEILGRILRDALHVLRSPSFVFDQREHHLSRLAIPVDAQGYAEISLAMCRATERLFQLGEEGARMKGRQESDSLVATSGMLLYERA